MEQIPEEGAGEPVIPESFHESLRAISDKASGLGLHVQNAMVAMRPSEDGPPTPLAFIDFVIGDLAFTRAAEEQPDAEAQRSLRGMEDGFEEDEYEAIRRQRIERRHAS